MASSGGKFTLFVLTLFFGLAIGWIFKSYFEVNSKESLDYNITMSDFFGTMMKMQKMDFSSSQKFGDEGIDLTGGVIIRSSRNSILTEITINSAALINGALEFNGDSYAPAMVSQLKNNMDSKFRLGFGSVNIEHKGENTFIVVFRKRNDFSPPMSLKLSYQGNVVVDKELSF